MEIERRWLVAGWPDGAPTAVIEMDQGYFAVRPAVRLRREAERGGDTLDNMLPACRSCNHYKSKSTLEGFRRMVESMPAVLMRDSVTYRNAVRFGLVTPAPHPVTFYFERSTVEGRGEDD